LVAALVPRAVADDGDLTASVVETQTVPAEPLVASEAAGADGKQSASEVIPAQASEDISSEGSSRELAADELRQPQGALVVGEAGLGGQQDGTATGGQRTEENQPSQAQARWDGQRGGDPPGVILVPGGPTASGIGGGPPGEGGWEEPPSWEDRVWLEQQIGMLKWWLGDVEALQAVPEADRGPVLGPAAAGNREDLEDMLAHIVRLEPQVTRWPDLEHELAALRSAVQQALRNLPSPMISVDLTPPLATPAQQPTPAVQPQLVQPVPDFGSDERQAKVPDPAGYAAAQARVHATPGLDATDLDTAIPPREATSRVEPVWQVLIAGTAAVLVGFALLPVRALCGTGCIVRIVPVAPGGLVAPPGPTSS